MTLSSAGSTVAANWETSGGLSFTASGLNVLAADKSTVISIYPYGKSESISSGQTYSYVIEFSNGQSISGALIAQ